MIESTQQNKHIMNSMSAIKLMKSNLSTTEKKLVEGICKHPKVKQRPDDYLIVHLHQIYEQLYRRPFNE